MIYSLTSHMVTLHTVRYGTNKMAIISQKRLVPLQKQQLTQQTAFKAPFTPHTFLKYQTIIHTFSRPKLNPIRRQKTWVLQKAVKGAYRATVLFTSQRSYSINKLIKKTTKTNKRRPISLCFSLHYFLPFFSAKKQHIAI